MARIRYATSCNDLLTVATSSSDRFINWRVGDEELAHEISDAINRGLNVRSTGLDAGDDWARLRARAVAREAAELASGVRADTGRRLQARQRRDLFELVLGWFHRRV